MDWSNERYVRIYVRDTKTWKLIGWEGQAVLCLLARRFDRAGLLDDVKDGEDVAIMIGSGFPSDVAQIGLDRLLKKDVFRVTDSGLFWPKFMDAQETPMSDAQRQRESRARRAEKARVESVTIRDNQSRYGVDSVTECDNQSRGVTRCHTVSQPVTPYRTVPYSTVPSVPIKTEETARTRAEYSVEFETFRNSYPKHRIGGKIQDWKSWKVAKAAGMTADKANRYLGMWMSSPKWRNSGGKYIVALSKWLRDGFWETSPPDYEPDNSPRKTPQQQQHEETMSFLADEWVKAKAEEDSGL